MTEYTKELAAWAAKNEYMDIPYQVISMMKKCLLDTLGCATAGSERKEIKNLINGTLDPTETGKASVWFQNTTAPIATALLINGAMNHAVELDDLHKPSKIHAGTVIVPSILTVGALYGISGKELLTSMAVGYEVMLRAAIAIGVDSHRRRGWHGTATCGAFGAAAAIGHIMGLNGLQMANAFGLAGTSTGGLMAYTADGSMSKRYHSGMAAMHGYLAAVSAKAGFTGPTYVFEAPDGGYGHAVSDKYDLEELVKDLSETWHCKDMGHKFYACCGHIHQAIDCAIKIRNENSLRPEDLEAVTVTTYDVAGMSWGFSEPPKNTVEAQFSFPYAVSAALVDGQAFIPQFAPERLTDPVINSLAAKVTVNTDDKFTSLYPKQWASGVEVKAKDQTYYTEVIGAKGDPVNPLSEQEIEDKFRSLSGGRFSNEQQDKMIAVIHNIERSESIAVIENLMRG
ncbi:MAG: MmgE/PrpD family protein [Clostridiaceae bacterium]|jgi:2-methylcitrate dehydratase PrpD|nr:MmgE/PrpD family protein [Clostridiaceae bacterium]